MGWNYIKDEDALVVGVYESPIPCIVYKNGKWGTPFYGRELPKTSVQLIKLLKDFCDESNLYGSDYLDQRDKDIRGFITKQGF